MTFINNSYDVTLAPNDGVFHALESSFRNSSGRSFEQAANINRIYQNNGLICQRKMCESMTGCAMAPNCPVHADWAKVVQFCGPVGTPAKYSEGALWRLEAADQQSQILKATQRATGMTILPTSYNVIGMY